jgi:hypothetical protein
MAAINQIVNIVISQETSAVPQASFSVPLIVGPTGFPNSDIIRYYTSAGALLADGFTSSSIEYIYAVEAFEQTLKPTQVGIGKRLTAVKQVDTVTPNVLDNQLYTLTVDGVDYAYTSDGTATAAEIAGALIALVNADTAAAVVATGTVTIILTAKVFGKGFTTGTADANLAVVHSTLNHGIADDLQAILNDPNGNLWYGLALCSNQVYDVEQAAAFIEGTKKIYIAASGDAAIDTNATTDVASVLKGKSYARTALIYSPGSKDMGIDAGLLGGQLPQTPGASTWKFKTVVGISPDFYTDNSRQRLIGTPGVSRGKSVNIFETVGGVNIIEEGWMVGGQFIDITVGLDWLESILQTNIYAILVNTPKIPYTDKGILIVENSVRSSLNQASDNGGSGLLDSTSIVVSAVKVASLPANTRAARILPADAVTFSARLTGAYHFITVNGTVTV